MPCPIEAGCARSIRTSPRFQASIAPSSVASLANGELLLDLLKIEFEAVGNEKVCPVGLYYDPLKFHEFVVVDADRLSLLRLLVGPVDAPVGVLEQLESEDAFVLGDDVVFF